VSVPARFMIQLAAAPVPAMTRRIATHDMFTQFTCARVMDMITCKNLELLFGVVVVF
jgi:hypothetical protein